MQSRTILLALFCFLLSFGMASPASAKSLISDISNRLITIDTSFKGTDILLFGARNDAGDIVVVIRGPKYNYIVRKKDKIAGIWVNQEQITFNNIESFYALASSRPLADLQNDALLSSLKLGLDNVPFIPLESEQVTVKITDFKDALVASKQRTGLYGKPRQDIPFIGEVLFKITIHFPENIPRGTYIAETYLINNGQLSAMQATPIIVKKVGMDAFISDAAYQHPALYGITAIALALLAGWLAGLIFRKL